MAAGCFHHEVKFDGMSPGFPRALWVVIALNAAKFFVEMTSGALAGSQALQADAQGFLRDTLTYGVSLFVLGMSLRVRATAALVKGLSLVVMGLWVFGSTAHKVLALGLPNAQIMGGVGLLALLANLLSVLVLMRDEDGDANVRSVWLGSRNDALGNIAVMGAAGGVFLTGQPGLTSSWRASWPGCSSGRRSRSFASRWQSAAMTLLLRPAEPTEGEGEAVPIDPTIKLLAAK